MMARGMTATSGRHGRSCEGAIDIHHAITPRHSAKKISDLRGRREIQRIQTAAAAKQTAAARRKPAHGRFE
jgi:hypothetical protein